MVEAYATADQLNLLCRHHLATIDVMAEMRTSYGKLVTS
jgi:hypothetical protein